MTPSSSARGRMTSPLAPLPLGEGYTRKRNKALVFSTKACDDICYTGIAIYSAEVVPSGTGSLSSIKP